MSQGENDYEKDLQRLTSAIAGKIGEGVQKTESFFSLACIYKVPEKLRKLKEGAYTPHLIAIGPLHREDKHLQTPLQHVKMSYTNYLISRQTAGIEDLESQEQKKFTVLQKCLAEMKTSIGDAKKCYAAEVLTLDEEMLLVDGCFILEFLYRSRSLARKNSAEKKGTKSIDGGDNGSSKGKETDPIFGNSLTVYTIENDLVLLENQIPFFVLEKLFRLTVDRIPDRHDKDSSLTDYVWWCYGYKMSPVGTSTKTWCSPRDCCLWVFGNKPENSTTAKNEDLSAHEYYHILHNLHDSYLPHGQTKQKEPSEAILMPSASELYFAGVKFVPDAGDSTLFKFEFKKPKALLWLWRRARFIIPPLAIYDHTELFLRNLIAFEQSCTGVSQNVTSYACVMDMLVNTDKDVQVLEKEGVMRNYLGAGEDATRLFNDLCKEIFEGEYYFADTCIEATEYSKSFWPKHVIHLRRTYFASPWTFIAFIVGFIAVVISFVEFVRNFLKKEKGGCSCEGSKRWS